MLNTLIIRAAAGFTLVVGSTLFAMEQGWIPPFGSAQAADQPSERVSFTSSEQFGAMTAERPSIELANVIVPMAEQSLAADALTVPTSFDAPMTTAETARLSPLGLPCGVSATATAMPAAVVALDVMAPCRANAPVTITHSGLQIFAHTDAVGLLTLDIPGFESPAFFSVTFADGIETSALVDLPDLQDYDRIGLNWQGNMGLELHAMEFGAGYGEYGHVWQETPAGPEAALAGYGGFMNVLETGDSFAQIYTLPRATLREGDEVRISIDAPITADNCTQNVIARTLRTEAANPVNVTELTFTVPGCDAIGDVLVLQNLLDDLRLASN